MIKLYKYTKEKQGFIIKRNMSVNTFFFLRKGIETPCLSCNVYETSRRVSGKISIL